MLGANAGRAARRPAATRRARCQEPGSGCRTIPLVDGGRRLRRGTDSRYAERAGQACRLLGVDHRSGPHHGGLSSSPGGSAPTSFRRSSPAIFPTELYPIVALSRAAAAGARHLDLSAGHPRGVHLAPDRGAGHGGVAGRSRWSAPASSPWRPPAGCCGSTSSRGRF